MRGPPPLHLCPSQGRDFTDPAGHIGFRQQRLPGLEELSVGFRLDPACVLSLVSPSLGEFILPWGMLSPLGNEFPPLAQTGPGKDRSWLPMRMARLNTGSPEGPLIWSFSPINRDTRGPAPCLIPVVATSPLACSNLLTGTPNPPRDLTTAVTLVLAIGVAWVDPAAGVRMFAGAVYKPVGSTILTHPAVHPTLTPGNPAVGFNDDQTGGNWTFYALFFSVSGLKGTAKVAFLLPCQDRGNKL